MDEVRCSLGLLGGLATVKGPLAHVVSDSNFKMNSSRWGGGQKYENTFPMLFSTALIIWFSLSVKGKNFLIKYPVGD